SAEVLPPHDLLDRFQRIAFGADRLKPALNIEKARLPHDSLAPSAHGPLRSASQIRSDLARRIFRGALEFRSGDTPPMSVETSPRNLRVHRREPRIGDQGKPTRPLMSDHPPARPPSSVMNSRRFITRSPRRRGRAMSVEWKYRRP